ncbi:stress-inducible protein [Streptomyces avidinii]
MCPQPPRSLQPSQPPKPLEPPVPLPFLVGFDGSARSLAAARWAAREARSAGVPLRLLHVGHAWPTIQPISPEFEPVLGASVVAAMAVLAATADELRAAHPGLTVETVSAEGGAASELPRAAAGAQLLVVGASAHDHHLLPLLGSTALTVAGRTGIPVVLVRETPEPPETPEPAVPEVGTDPAVGIDGMDPAQHAHDTHHAHHTNHAPRGQGVVVGVDPAGDYGPALDFAYAWASVHGLPLRAVHAVHAAGPAEPQGQASLEAAVAAASARHPDVPTTCAVRPGEAATVLLEESAAADLLVVGRRHHRALHGPGPTDHAAAYHSHAPVALIPHA